MTSGDRYLGSAIGIRLADGFGRSGSACSNTQDPLESSKSVSGNVKFEILLPSLILNRSSFTPHSIPFAPQHLVYLNDTA